MGVTITIAPPPPLAHSRPVGAAAGEEQTDAAGRRFHENNSGERVFRESDVVRLAIKQSGTLERGGGGMRIQV